MTRLEGCVLPLSHHGSMNYLNEYVANIVNALTCCMVGEKHLYVMHRIFISYSIMNI